MTVILVQFEASSAWMSGHRNSQYLNNRIEQDRIEESRADMVQCVASAR